MTNIEKHFKERSPEETLNIVKNFFQSKGFTIQEDIFRESEVGTYSNRFELIKDGIVFQGANGKGMTPEYCRASAAGELYERYCNLCNNLTNSFIMDYNLEELNLKKLSYEDVAGQSFIKEFFLYLFQNDKIKMKDFIENRFGKKFYGWKYNNLLTNKEEYIDNRFVDLIDSSTGLSAGNTYNEALNQALSEVLQRYIEFTFFLNPQEKYYCIDFRTIKNKNIIKLIDNIKKLNYDFYIVDLSYNFHLPVLMSILINKKEKNIEINFGSFPVIDIALERIITELYQGISSFKRFTNNQIMIPFKEIVPEILIRNNFSTYAFLRSFPENFFEKIIFTSYNKNIFLEDDYTNEYLTEYLLNICQQNNFTPYCANLSQAKDIKAIRVLIPQIVFRKFLFLENENFNFNKPYTYIMNIYKFVQMIKDNVDNQTLINFYKNNCLPLFLNQTNEEKDFISDLTFSDPLTPFGLNSKCSLEKAIKELLLNFNNITIEDINNFDTIFYPYFKKYLTLKEYIFSRKYSKDEIKNFFQIFNDEITEEDFNNINNPDYLFEKIYLMPIKNYIFSNDYKRLSLTIAGLT